MLVLSTDALDLGVVVDANPCVSQLFNYQVPTMRLSALRPPTHILYM